MWIRIDCIRIRIQAGSRSIKSANFQNIFKFLKVKKTLNFSSHSEPTFVRFRLKTFNAKKKIFVLAKLCFSLHFISDFIPLDPDPDPESGSGSTDPNESRSDRIRIHITAPCDLSLGHLISPFTLNLLYHCPSLIPLSHYLWQLPTPLSICHSPFYVPSVSLP